MALPIQLVLRVRYSVEIIQTPVTRETGWLFKKTTHYNERRFAEQANCSFYIETHSIGKNPVINHIVDGYLELSTWHETVRSFEGIGDSETTYEVARHRYVVTDNMDQILIQQVCHIIGNLDAEGWDISEPAQYLFKLQNKEQSIILDVDLYSEYQPKDNEEIVIKWTLNSK